MSKTLCPLPWMHLSQRNNGHYRACCHTDTRFDKGLVKNESGEFLHASSAKILDVRNSQTLKEMRVEMLKGNWHKQCSLCQSEEVAGLKSPRENAVEKWAASLSYEQASSRTNVDGSIETKDFPLLSYDIRLGNVCNLKCRMCGPMDSRSWYADYQKLYKINHFKDTHGNVIFTDQNKNDPYLWFEDPFFWDQLFLQKDHIQSLYLVGGEPLLIEQHFEFLKKLVDDGASKNIELVYNTNLTHLDENMISLWRSFRSVGIGVSTDGINEVNDYVRAPSQFFVIEQNIEILDKAGGNIHLWLAPTVQIYNILHIPDMIRWILKKDFLFLRNSQQGLAFFHPLHRPVVFNIQTLPKNVKLAVEKKYELLLDELASYRESHLKNTISITVSYLRGILDFMNAKDTSTLLPEFLKQTHALDKIRKQTFAQALPELHIMLQENNTEISQFL